MFIGGDDQWKDGPHPVSLIAQATARSKWAHAGRVNTLDRLLHFAGTSADSADGTTFTFGPDKNLPQMLRWLDRIHTHGAQGILL